MKTSDWIKMWTYVSGKLNSLEYLHLKHICVVFLPWLQNGGIWLHTWFSWQILNEDPDIVNPGSHEKVTLEPMRYAPFNIDGGFVWPLAGVGSSQVTTD